MVVIGHRNKFYHVQQVNLISILENERAILIEYSFHWQWWDIFPLLMSCADHMKVDILFSPCPSPHCMRPTCRKETPDTVLVIHWDWTLKTECGWQRSSGETNTPQHHPAACSQSDTGIRYRNEKLVAVMWNHFCTILSPKKDWKQH